MKSRSRATILCAALALSTGAARAQTNDTDRATASQLFDEAQSLAEAGNVHAACEKYSESNRLDPQLGTLLYLGDCYAQEGRTASAWLSFRDAVDIAMNRHDERERAAKEQLETLSSQLSRLSFNVNGRCPLDLEILVDGRAVSRATAIPLDPGKVRVTARAPGFADWQIEAEIPKGPATTVVNVPELVRLPTTEVAPRKESATSATALATKQGSEPKPPGLARADLATAHRSTSAATYVLFATGAVATSVGTVFAVLLHSSLTERDKANRCSSGDGCSSDQVAELESLTTEAKQRATVANVGFVVGGASLIGGLMTMAFTGTGKPTGSAGQVGAHVGPKQAGISWETSW